MSTHANMVKMTTATTGTGTITLGSASSGYQSFADAYGANATVDVLIADGTAWEVARNCTYTHSGTTLTRGTLEDSSTGSALNLTGSAVVSVVATADSGRRWDSAALEHVAGTDADTTMAVGMMYVTPMSAWATANRTYTLPATAAVGSRIGIMVTSGNASYELIIKPGASDTINAGTAAAEWSRLFITGEVVILRCVTADSAWVVEYDGRRSGLVTITPDGSTTQTCTRNAVTQLTTVLNTVVSNPNGEWDSTNKRFYARRSGTYFVEAASMILSLASAQYCVVVLYKNGSQVSGFLSLFAPTTSSNVGSGGAKYVELVSGDYIDLRIAYGDAAVDKNASADAGLTYFNVQQVF